MWSWHGKTQEHSCIAPLNSLHFWKGCYNGTLFLLFFVYDFGKQWNTEELVWLGLDWWLVVWFKRSFLRPDASRMPGSGGSWFGFTIVSGWNNGPPESLSPKKHPCWPGKRAVCSPKRQWLLCFNVFVSLRVLPIYCSIMWPMINSFTSSGFKFFWGQCSSQ